MERRLRAMAIVAVVPLLMALVAPALAEDPPPTDGAAVVTPADHAAAPPGAAAETGAHEAGEAAGESAHHGPDLGRVLPLWSVIPFVGILLSIAIFPLLAPHFWHHHFPKISAAWALVFAIPFVIAYGGQALSEIAHIYVIDYIPFIILLWALFTVAGGILVRGSLNGTPQMNVVLLLIGTAIASWVGTTGAAMLLIRPVLRANARRQHKVHTIVFFIFLVANVGGSLTPLGDPPLFLGFLHGVPFFWTLGLVHEMGFVAAILLVVYAVMDLHFWRRETAAARLPEGGGEKLRIEGLHNLLFLGGILAGVIMSGTVHLGHVSVLGVHQSVQNLLRDGILIAMGVLSMVTTSKQIRRDNGFSWFPIQEVAYLFAGIFMTIIPALAILKAGTAGHLGFLVQAVREPWHFFWVTGALSSFLDNAPTYLTFLTTAEGLLLPGMAEPAVVLDIIAHHAPYLVAISTGAVFMGAVTYIGNAPNFMVKSIAEETGVEMPSFFGYMFKYSLPILMPAFILVTLVFF